MKMKNIPAFPNKAYEASFATQIVHESGMSLRDYFASKAMIIFIQKADLTMPRPSNKDIAESSYDIASAMLKAREQSE